MKLKVVEQTEAAAPAARRGLTLGGAPRTRDAGPGLSYALGLRAQEPSLQSTPAHQARLAEPLRLATRHGVRLA